ncbi:MAG: helix-turn-helix transcriptional regulator [Lachnospiraceae bacterium]|nr:helix-turn-helix transcriptional regulator [Lachnospiraceae bacterium]
MTIYERIRALRTERGYSQAELAEKVGYVGRSAISKVENGERDISQSMIAKYAEALGVTPAYLLYGDEEPAEVTPADQNSELFVQLFSELHEDHQKMIIAQMKGILATYNTED